MKTFRELFESKISVGDYVDFHTDLGKMKTGKVLKVSKDILTIDLNGVKFKRNISDIFTG